MSELAGRIASLSPEKRALLTQRLKKKRTEAAKKQAIPRREDLDSYPMSFAQQRLWFLDQYEPDSPFYNIPAALRLTGQLDVAALEWGLNEVVRRHEVLRATFVTEKGHPVQVIAPEPDLTLPVADLQHLPGAEKEAGIMRLATEEAQKPFDLTQGPLVRASLLKLGKEEHVALLTMHHIVSDGWSIGVLVREIAMLYEAFSAGKPTPLPELPIQYADFAHWQREWLRGESLARQLEYWRGQLGDSPPVLELPTDRPRPAIQTYNGAHLSFYLSKELSEALKASSRREDTTLFMTLLAAFQALLYRYTRQEDIGVGTPIANRNRAEIEGLIGFFVNTLVMRTDLSGEPTFRELLERVREVALGAYAHQDVPFEMLVDELQLERNLSHTPLFQVVFALQDALTESLELSGLKLNLLEIENGTAKFDLTLFMEERADGLKGMLEYNTDLFDAATVERLAGHFQVLLEGIVANPDQSISALPLLTEAERHQLLTEWNDTAAVAYSQDQCLHELFETQAAHTPGTTAVVFEGKQLTYEELNRRANQLAHYLRRHGVGPGELVGIYMDRSLEIVVAILSILKAGGAYVPFDPTYPEERLAFMLKDTRVPVLLTQQDFIDALTSGKTHTVCLDSQWETIAHESDKNPDSEVIPQNYAYVLYTSGSTGRPKGVCCHHAGVVNLLEDFEDRQPLSVGSNCSWWTSPNFDVSVYEIFSPLLNGGTLHIVPDLVRHNAFRFAQWLSDHKIHSVYIPPFMLADFSAWLHEQAVTPVIHRLLVGVEPIHEQLLAKINAKIPGLHIINGYGPTETTICSTLFSVQPHNAQDRNTPIGRPVNNAQVYLLDTHLQPVPIGAPGEVYIGGTGVSWGYLNRPELTADRFVPDPFGAQPGARLYKTGDVACHLNDGNIMFQGRVDYQVKIRGFRIELGEIQKALGQHPDVRDVIALVREDTPGDKRLVAYVIPEEDSPSVGDLRGFLKKRLPEHMVPSGFIFLDAFPLSPSGKIDRRALPAPDKTRPELERPYIAPRTAVEHFLIARWQELLGIDKIGVHDNFFELGGDSLQAAVLINRLQEELDETTHVKALFMAPTVADMAVYMAEYYPSAVAKIDRTALLDEHEFEFEKEIAASGRMERVDVSTIAQMRQLIPALPPREDEESPASKNPPAIFILSPPRSGSTLFRTMLAGHPRLFAPPELDLLSFNRLDERRTAFTGESSFWLQGPIHAIIELRGCDVEEATQMMENFERQKLTTKEFYGLLQEWMGGRRLVDKTPTYPLDLETLKRMEADFENAQYIHLFRHPYATLYSFVEAKLDQVFFRHEYPFSRRVLAELVWIVGHQNTLEFLQTIPQDRQYRLAFEDLVTRPEPVMRGVCQFLGVEFHPALVRPYDGDRMTDGIRPGEQMVGDFKFYLRKEIDAGAADRWKKFHTVDFLSDVGWEVAESLGYEKSVAAEPSVPEREISTTRIQPIPRDGDLPLSFAQQRLWFLDQFEPGSPFYNVPSAVRLAGPLDVAALEQSLNEIVQRHQVLRTTFQTVDGRAVQVIAPKLTLTLPVVDLGGLPEAEREAEVRRLAAENAQQPFDLAQGPLLRVTLLRLERQEHVVLLNMHHIVSDGWSIGVLIQEVAALYESFAAGKPSPLPELPIQYVDYAHWQREWLQGEVLESQLAYWKQQLDGIPPLLELPADRPRPAVQTFRGTTLWFDLPRSLSEAIKTLSRQEEVSLFMTLLAALQTLLYRYTGQDDISVGTPIANRNRVEIAGLIGFFVNTLVLRTYLAGDPSFRELLGRVREVAMGAYTHQDVPFEMLVDELQPERDMSHTPLFQVMLALQDAPMEALKLPGLTLGPLGTDSGTAKFDIVLSIVGKADGLKGSLEYNTDLFDGDTIERMAAHFQTLLEGIVADPDQPISTLPLLTAAERQQLLIEWNDTEATYPQNRCAHHLFEAQVERTPNALAVTFEGDGLAYRELNQRANQLAHYLQKRGVGPEVVVGICTERSLEMIVGILGTLKAGGGYLPLDPDYPSERLAFMLNDAKVPVVLTQASLLKRLEQDTEHATRVFVCLDAEYGQITEGQETNPVSEATPDNLAYIIYTSGSTGQPKGALLQHRGLCNLAHAYMRQFQVGPGSRVLQFFSISFDGSVADIFMTLLSGATLYLVPQDARLPGVPLVQFLRQQAVTHGVLTPSVLAVLPQAKLPAFHSLAVGGEACPPELVARWAPERRFFNVYGPTEATVVSTWYQAEEFSSEMTNVPIGRPVPNTRIYVLDRHLELVPVGVPGELYVGGVGVARGYVNRPELTAERFIPDPFSDDPEKRLYKTGDLCRYLPDGNIEFLGRIDHQVKVRGFRIELGEIEAVLSQHPVVGEVVVLAREDTPGDKRLVAYVVPEDGQSLNVSELRGFLKENLPEYMVPSAFMPLDGLPLTPSGKVNSRALPAPDQARPDLEAIYIAPRTQKEEILAGIWAQLLGVEQVGVHDNFFELGGDSILSIQVIARAKQTGLQLTPRQLFESPTVAGLAAVAGTGPVIQAEQGIVEGVVPLTPIQRWFFEQDLPEPHHWNQAILLEVRQPLEPALLEAAVGHLMEHHDALRLRFERISESASQRVSELANRRGEVGWEQVNVGVDGDVPFTWIDLSGLPEAEQGPAVENHAAALQASLDLTAGPLLRVAYFDLGTGRPGRLLMAVHHQAIDGISWRILMEDFQTAYQQLSRGKAVQLPPKTTSFKYWAQRLSEYAQSEAVQAQLSHWLSLAQDGVAHLPVDYPGGDNTEASARSVRVSLNAKETQALIQDVPAAYGAEINDTLLTALAQAMARWTGSRTLLVDLEGHGREDVLDDVDLSRTVGWFTTVYPVSLHIENTDGPGEALKAVKEQSRQVPSRGISYGLLRYLNEDEGVVDQLRALPQAEVSFNYLGQFDQALPDGSPFGIATESSGPERSLLGNRSHLLSVSGSIAGGRLQLQWAYGEDLYRRATIESLAEDFMEALRALIAHCQSPEARGYTPSDFGDVDLSQDDIEALLTEVGEAQGFDF
ncbi:MAG: amino acid adenylation domain-containing protein [Chloroflexota bacterium]|nr:amino acid adenylation domain-containing protein [Chloroflexota bacterium]